MIETLIVDDEPLALDILENHISRVPQMLSLAGRCQNAFEAMEFLRRQPVQLLFLDIQMPQLNGIEMLKILENSPRVILTTADPSYALEGYDLNIVDYLLKPVSFERFMKAVNKAAALIERPESKDAAAEPAAVNDHFFVKSEKKLIRINFDDIFYIEGLKDYVIIRLTTGRVITLQTMKSLEEKLPRDKFRRIHRSYIVQLDKVDALMGNMVEIDKKHLPIGKNYRDELSQFIDTKKL